MLDVVTLLERKGAQGAVRLNTKIGLILGLPMLIVFGLLGTVMHAAVMQRFETLERREIEQNHGRLLEALNNEFLELERLAVDWSVWDETYNYMRGTNPGFRVANFTPATFENLSLDGLLIYDPQHRLFDDFTFDAARQQFVKQDPALIDALAEALRRTGDERQGHGIVEFNGRILQVGMSSILDSNGEGEPQGTLIMMRWLGDTKVDALAKRIRLELAFHRLGDDGNNQPQLQAPLAQLAHTDLYIRADAERIAAYSLLTDLAGSPAVLMQVSMPRVIVREGREAVRQLLGASLGILVLFTIGIFLAVRQVALKRLSRMSRALVNIGSDGGNDVRLTVKGNDEIDRLAKSVNVMLDGLDRAYNQRRQAAERQRELNALLVRIATDEALAHGDADALFRVIGGSLSAGAALDRWSLWLTDEEGQMQCLRQTAIVDGAPAAPDCAAIVAALAQWDGRSGAPLQHDALGHPCLVFPFAVEQRRGALCVEALTPNALQQEDELNFLAAATQLIERSLRSHFQRQREEALRQQAEFDALTGLANRPIFERRLRRALQQRATGVTIAVLFIDLDRFKPVNDQYGHAMGDWLLYQVAQRLKERVRSNDLVARLGGDEFTVILTGLKEPGAAGRVASKLVEALHEPFVHPQATLHIGCSIGLAWAPTHGEDFDSLVQAADHAMYAAKQAGRNAWRAAPEPSAVPAS